MEVSIQYDSSIIGMVKSVSATSSNGQIFIYDLSSQQIQSEFNVKYDFGGKRYALSQDGQSSFVGCYRVHGLACYSNENGKEVWRRKDLKKVQFLKAFPHAKHVFCGRDGAGHLIDSNSGETIEKTKGVKSVYPSPFSEHILVAANDLEVHLPFGTRIGKVSRSTFAELDSCFSPHEVLISESAGPIRCYDSSSMELLWAYSPPEGYHFLRVCYSKDRKCFVGRMWRYLDQSDPYSRLFHFDCRLGSVLNEIKMPKEIPTMLTFCLSGSAMVAHDFRLWDIECNQIAELPEK